ncbi:hypothetical protein GPJ56_002154 [Histomonas meleagridis]|uniref:uncharacterized protein n=1 Tax=Histomonas meleagridis TaxID=135588 RepID=UPI003559F6B9|nr:hypothetical protein GPJ56_002154 [Histomonas meleagridis]KAH0806667.1 hypothetical protein GO595_000518 [Histomonas meleagridis]
MYATSSGSVRPKIINFTVFIFKSGKKKIFGKFEVDVSQFYNTTGPKMINVQIQTPHSGKNDATMTFSSSSNQTGLAGSGTNTDDNLTSMSEAIQLTTDVQDDWDVSDIVSPDDKEKINKFFQQRHQEREEKRNDLAQFTRSHPSRQSSRNRLKHASVNIAQDHVAAGGRLSAFLSQKSKASPKPIDPIQSEPKQEETDPLPHAINLITSILSKTWEESPLNFSSTPKSVSAVISVFTHVNFFEPTAFDDEKYFQLITHFNTLYKESVLVKDWTLLEQFLVSLNILSCIQTDLRLDQDRVKTFVGFFSPTVSSNFDVYINSITPQFIDIRSGIISLSSDVETLAKGFVDKVKEVSNGITASSKIIELIISQLKCVVDAKLVESLVQTPSRCLFSNAVQWNTLLTILESDYQTPLPLFREAVSVLMMATTLCASPESKADICKQLNPATVLKIMELQKPDEMMPIENDVNEFCKYFGLEPNAEFKPISITYQGNFDDLLQSMPNEWIQNSFPKEILDEFPFMNTFFA